MSFLRYALFTVPAAALLGTLSLRLAGAGGANLWFAALARPAWVPPASALGAGWAILYVLLGLALAMLLHARGAHWRRAALALFLAQLGLGYAWPPLFFAFHEAAAALVVTLAMIGLAAAAAALAWWIRPAASLLLLPYLAWLCFTAALTLEIVRLNPDAAALVSGGPSADIPIRNAY